MVTVEDFSRLVSGIYAAAVTPQHWQMAIRGIQRTLDGTGGSLLLGDGAVWSFQNSTLAEGALESYAQHYAALDYPLAAVKKGPMGEVRTGPDVIFRNQNREFYDGWMRPNELEDGLFVRLTRTARPTCFLVTSPTRSFDTPERVMLMSALVPHLHQALRTQDKLAALSQDTVEIAGALDVIRHGIVVVASENVVVNLNSASERMLRDGDGLCIWSGRITAASARTDRQLHHAIRDALDGDGSVVRRGSSLTCSRPSGKRPFVIHVLPSPSRDADDPLKEPLALILIIDPEDEPEPAAALLRRLYHLTRAEADVASRVMHGSDLKEISEQLSISLATVRTHLQRVFDKTDTHRQAELVRLLFVLCP